MEQIQTYRMFWKERKDGGACLVRLYGTSPQIHLPSKIEGRSLVEIAPYCFAKKESLTTKRDEIETIVGEEKDAAFLKELCQTSVEEVYLPDSVQKIGSYAFYNCKNLHTLQIGPALQEVGSDAFMNTLSFHWLILRCGAKERSGIRQIVSQISSDLHVQFVRNGQIEAALLYPEYYESYDEIAPAHLFGRQIHGEGFRARQCIKDGKVDFAGYDAVFLQACAGESENTLGQMALNRIKYPYMLLEKDKEMYQTYIKEHIHGISGRLVTRKSLDMLQLLYEERLMSYTALLECSKNAAKSGWTKGSAFVLQCLAKERPAKENRYDFNL